MSVNVKSSQVIPDELAALLKKRRDNIVENIDFGVILINDDCEISNWHNVLLNAVMMSDVVDDYIRDYRNDRCSRDEYGLLVDRSVDFIDKNNITDHDQVVSDYIKSARETEVHEYV